LSDLKYWVGFSLINGVGAAIMRRIQEYFGDMAWAWHASAEELAAAGLEARLVQEIQARRGQIPLDQEMERLEELGIGVLTWDHPAYPPRLKEIAYPPFVLYVRGDLLPQDEWAVAVVGTRRATAYGREAALHLAGDLARSGITIVSGLAKGIDSISHRAALEAGGRTIAVLGNGLDMVYPRENERLAGEILGQGALLSEYPLGTKPVPTNFPWRNRIISGLSLGVLVVEAGLGSGANLTVKYALEQDREVFAVPGSIFWPRSQGTNKWIREGAKLVMAVEDILEELNLQMIPQQQEARELLPGDEVEAALLAHLSADPVHIDALGASAGLPISLVSSTLTMMELKGMVRQVGAMNYVRARETQEQYRVRLD
jgi:DNA processing protein